MANEKILKQKQETINEIKNRVNESSSVIVFDYRGITDAEVRELRENEADYKVYKNTLVSRAFDDLKIDMKDVLTGPSAFAFGSDQVGAIKTISKFAKTHPALIVKAGIIDGEIADQAKLNEYASLPSREGLLTMLAGGMIGLVRDLSICLDLYAKEKEEN